MAGASCLDMAFAYGALCAWADVWMMAPEQVYDRLFEGSRHAIIELDAAVCPRDCRLLRPLLDLLAGLKLQEEGPVATAILGAGMHGLEGARDWGRACPSDLEVILTALPRLQALARPLGPTAIAVVRLTAHCGVPGLAAMIPCSSFSQSGCCPQPGCVPSEAVMAQELWDRLRTTGLQDLAPVLFEHGVREVKDIMPNAGALLLSGVESWKLEAIVRGRLETALALPPGRPDHPVAEVRQKASWTAALEAALPENRQASLEALQAAVLAATTKPSVESRLRAWRELSAAWERPPFPVSPDLVRCVGASLRAGGYHSCSLYFSAATSHQLRTLALPIGEETRFIIRDTVRAIWRGLGPARLKDAFD